MSRSCTWGKWVAQIACDRAPSGVLMRNVSNGGERQMKRFVLSSALACIGLSASLSAQATIPMPNSGTCAGGPCLTVTNTATSVGEIAISAIGTIGVYGNSNTGSGVKGETTSGKGVQGFASSGRG